LSKNVNIRIYKTTILPVVLYEWETWSLILRKEHRLRGIIGLKRDEMMGERERVFNEELPVLYSSPSIIIIIKSRKMKRAGHVARIVEKVKTYRLLKIEPDGKRPLERSRRYDIPCRGRIEWYGLNWPG
jgi:hypothetical protein